MTQPTPKPYLLAPIVGNGHSDGYRLNIHGDVAGGGLGMRICQIPAFTWRSREAVIELGNQLRAAPVLIAALEGAIGALEFSRDYHKDLGNEEQAFAQDKLDAAVNALAIARGEAAV